MEGKKESQRTSPGGSHFRPRQLQSDPVPFTILGHTKVFFAHDNKSNNRPNEFFFISHSLGRKRKKKTEGGAKN